MSQGSKMLGKRKSRYSLKDKLFSDHGLFWHFPTILRDLKKNISAITVTYIGFITGIN